MDTIKYPETYLHVYHCQSGDEYIVAIKGNEKLDLEHHVRKWIDNRFDGECYLDGKMTPLRDGEYYAKILTDGREPTSPICWSAAGFYVGVKK